MLKIRKIRKLINYCQKINHSSEYNAKTKEKKSLHINKTQKMLFQLLNEGNVNSTQTRFYNI